MLLFVTNRSRLARSLAASLLPRGIYLLHAPLETAEFMCDTKDIGGLLLDCVTDPDAAVTLAHTLRDRYPHLPMAAILSPHALLDLPADRLLRQAETDTLVESVSEFCALCGWNCDRMGVFDLDMTQDPDKTYYMGYPLPLSPREHAILRCLFYRSPHLTSSDDLMSLCYPLERKGISNLAVLIRRINQRAAEIDPRPLIISVYAKGYRLRDGILE